MTTRSSHSDGNAHTSTALDAKPVAPFCGTLLMEHAMEQRGDGTTRRDEELARAVQKALDRHGL
jgi:hypothetical protein